MSKRRRTPSIASRSVDEDTNESDSQSVGAMETSRKKRKLDPFELMQNLYDTIRNFKKEDGTLLCDAFIRVPKRRQEPGYHDVVANPIDLLKIQQKLKTEDYDDVEDMQVDMELLVNNAKSFYKRSSQEFKDANELWDLFLQTKARIFETCDEVVNENKAKIILKVGKFNRRLTGDAKKQESVEIEESSTESWATNNEDELSMCEELFTAVITATDPDGRPIYPVFQLLPSRKRYPKYYMVIENPIDLRTIARKIQDGKYTSLNDMEKDLLLLTKNACTFNEPGSQIYKDAKMLKKIISSRKIEIEHGKSVLEKKSERIRNKRLRGSAQSLSAITAALQSEDEDSDVDEEAEQADSMDEEPDNPRWQLYHAIRTYTNPQGVRLAEPFLKLPSKRYYANYYKEIRNPLSLFQIRKKLCNGHYGTVSEVAGDLNILFENTKKFNKPDTKLYKDAVKLQKVMQAKVQELLDFQHQYSDSEEDSTDGPTAVKRVKLQKNLGRGKYSNNIPLKRRLYALCKCLMDYVTEDGRQPMLMFMEKPSKKLYPDYYKVIQEPIDMLTIENNIRSEKYNSEEEILEDFKLMFRNCREYNEEGSLIYEDAITLERVLMDFIRDGGSGEKRTPAKILSQGASPGVLRTKKLPLPPPTPTMMKMRTLFSTIKDYKDPKGRQLSVIFNKLPSKIEYPDYYEVIKRPINLEIISQKLKGNCYENLEDLVSDFVLMFDNAFKYNEPDSQIYKDALVLQRVTLQTKLQLREDEDTVPDVPSAVQELLTSLFTAVYNHQDEESRCFSDSLAELPEHDEVDGKKIRALSLDLIKRRLDSGQYRRLDMFQDEMFSCLERARRLSRTDSQVFEDSIELQSYFIRQRDELCRNGDLLNSPALNYTHFDLSTAVNSVRETKCAEECADSLIKDEEIETPAVDESVKEEEEDGSSVIQSTGNSAGAVDNAMSYNQQVYRIGDFVYAESKERGMEWLIFNIQRLWVNQDNQQMMYGNHYYRPSETYHVTTRRFLEKEVFKTDQHIALPLNCIKGRCAVLSVKDYFRFRPEGFDDKDIYVCESRYSTRARLFKKIKCWPPGLTNVCKLIEREEPLEPKRTVSVYRDRVEKHKEEIAELEEQEKYLEKEKPNVVAAHSNNNDENCTYYEQYNAPQCLIKAGDCVYLRNENINNTSRTLVCQINKIWTTKDEKAFIYGPLFVLPSDVPHPPNKSFYKQEILLSTTENTIEVGQIIGKCAVLEHSEYISCRPTEIPESEVYICESMFDEAGQQITDLPKDGLKKFVHSPAVYQDEIYFFRRLINPTKVNATGEPEQLPTQPEKTQIIVQNEVNFQSCSAMVKAEPSDIGTEDSMDGGPPSVCSSDMGAPSTPNSNSNFTATTFTSKKKRGNCDPTKAKLVTGYILYSSDIRRTVTQNNPSRTFGEVSRIVGNEWKKLTQAEKNVWEEKAQRINEETQAKIEKGEIVLPPPSNSLSNALFVGPTLPDHVWECMWNNCDYMFEDQQDCLDHAIGDASGHVPSTFAGITTSGAEYQCQWRACPRLKKNSQPFPSLHRLMRHVKEVHISKSIGRVCPPSERSKHYVPSKYPRITPVNTVTSSASSSDNALSYGAAVSSTTVVSSIPPLAATISTSAASATLPIRDTPSPVVQNGTNGITINGAAPKRNNEPLFVVIPPKPHRILHSDIYLKYIEGLSADKPTQVSNWEKQLYATQESLLPLDPNKLPVHWLGNGVGNHGNVMNALWALREYMMRDALNISKVI